MGAEWFVSELLVLPGAARAKSRESTDLLKGIALYAS
jgi:hypothetical protein